VYEAGFLYDSAQDIIYSSMNALQRETGFCHLYDEAAPAIISAIIDCEPIRFHYGGKDWMIELWKGQYGLETGAEIGVYNLKEPKPVPLPKLEGIARSLPGPFANSFLSAAKAADAAIQNTANNAAAIVRSDWLACADDSDRLMMSFTLFKNGKELFRRGPEKHWWLTGFKWGVISTTDELTADIHIECKDTGMQNVFANSLTALGYTFDKTANAGVHFTFGAPRTPQPGSRTLAEQLVQQNNTNLVETYNAMKQSAGITSNDPNLIPDKVGGALVDYFNSFVTLKKLFDSLV